MRVVSTPGINRQGGALDSTTGGEPMAKRQDGVLLSPEGGDGRERLHLTDPLPGLHVLAQGVDDTSDGSPKGTGAPGYASINGPYTGNVASRSPSMTSRPSPPDATSASRSIRDSSSRSIHCATPPPYEWPQRCACVTPIASIQAEIVWAYQVRV
jgi:hypothetical protein